MAPKVERAPGKMVLTEALRQDAPVCLSTTSKGRAALGKHGRTAAASDTVLMGAAGVTKRKRGWF